MISAPVQHVLMTADTVGGVWTYALELARAFEERGIRVSLATMGAALRPDQWKEADWLSNLTVYESEYKLEWMEDPWRDVEESGAWLLNLERKLKPDVVHLNGYAHGSLPWNAPSVVVAHSCVLSWWHAVEGEEAPGSWEEYLSRVATGIHGATHVVAVSQAMLADVTRFYETPRSAVVIPNGRRCSDFIIRTKENFIFASGRVWDRAKNIVALENIAAELEWPVVIAGEGTQDFKAVRWLGRLSTEEIAPWFARAAIYAAPARYEPFGLAVLEAALSGCALVLGDIASLRENWDGAALFVSPADEQVLKSALIRLIEDRDLRERMSALAVERAARFTTDRMATGYLDAYAYAAVEASARCV
jgi:glycosyltransferase involved in cell wall biosynthesis